MVAGVWLIPEPSGLWNGLVVYPNGTEQWARRHHSLDDQKREMFTVVDSVH